MPSPEIRSRSIANPLLVRLDALAWSLACAWAVLLGLSLWLNLRGNYREAEDYARTEARASYEKDILYRRWVSLQGGVYVTPTEAAPANPFLAHLPERDVSTTTGKSLTLINPAYMTRMVHELGAQQYGVRGHITSLKPLRPQNAADPWEADALRAFERGAREAVAIVDFAGAPALRYMRPFVTEASCLKCHAIQGYQVGDVRGGVSTTVPLASYYATAWTRSRNDIVFHSTMLLLGLAGIGFGRRSLGRALHTREVAHGALRESERRNRQLIERLPLVAVTRTLDGTITHANPALLTLTGRTLEHTLGHDFFELFVPRDQRAAEQEAFQRFLREHPQSVDRAGTILDRDNRPRSISWIHTLVTDEQGGPVGVTSLGEDITLRNAEDLHLRLLSCAVEQSPSVVVITDAKGSIEYVNARFCEVTGYSAAEALGQNPRLLSSGRMPPEFYRELWETILAGREWRGVFHNRRRNGEHFWEEARVSPIRDAAGTIVRFLALKEDITARRSAERALAESEQRFRTLVENAPVAVVAHNVNRCLYANSSALRLFGYDERAAIAGIDIRTHLQPATIAVVAERERRAAAGQPNPPVELELRRCDGTLLVCESIATRITYADQPATLALIVDITERRQMLAAIEESEARYRTLVEVAPVAIFSLSNGRFTYANPGAARLLGFAQPAELLGASVWQRVHADSLTAVTTLLSHAEAGRESQLTELTLVRQDREPVSCATVAVPINFGRQSAVLLLASDITEHKRLADTLRENEARIRETLESTNAGYFLLDPQDRIVHANSAFLQFFDQPTLAAARGRPFPELLPEPERPAVAEQLLRLACGEEFIDGQLRHRRPDGALAYFNFTAHLVREAGALAGCEGFILDTTAAHTSEERYQMLFEQMLDAVALHEIICDAAGTAVDYRFIAINPAFERLVGRPAAALVGRRVREVFPDIDAKWISRYGEVALEGHSLRIEDYSRETDRHVEVSAFRPSPGHFVTLVRDITERQRLEQQLQQAQKMEAVGQLAGGVAHDYNNILVAILMNLSLLRNETNLRPETAESLLELEREAKRAATLTRQLLVFSRREAVQAVCLDFNDQLESMLKMLRRLLGEHIVIESELRPGLPPILADPGMLDQVVMNLCVNARDAMPTGGRLRISTTAAEFTGATAAHPGARPGAFLEFTVRDTGSGMDAATRRRIFEPFFTTKDSSKGTGLGLATVFGIVKQHSGWIEVESAPGQGSTFRIYLPFAPAGAGETATDETVPTAATKGTETILLVEDDTVARQTISLTLRRDGYQVIEATDVATALAAWQQHHRRIAALITDVVMPGGRSGLELAHQLHGENPALSIIIISGYSDDAVRTTPVVAGATYLAKPFDYDTLTQALRASLARQRR